MGQYRPPVETSEIAAALTRVAAALREAGVDFALAGSVACWARGGPPPSNDLDLAVRPDDAQRAAEVLEHAGLRTERPPEGWLLKAWDGEVLVDLIWDFEGGVGIDELIGRAEDASVQSVHMPVLRLDDVMVSKLMAFDEHALDFAGALGIARALREQIDWDEVRERTSGSPYARGFMALLLELEIVEPPRPWRPHQPRRVRVVPDG